MNAGARACFTTLPRRRPRAAGVVALGAALAAAALAAPVVPIDPALGETVIELKNGRLLPVDLETTVFRPPGDGPFPVVLINHGKVTGNNRLQARYRPLPAVREFLQRGYAVVVPMRQGFSNSGGRAVGEGCNIAANGDAQADDVRAVVAWLVAQPWADAQHMLMLGQSHGGLTTLAYARDPHPGFRLFVNFAGGLRYQDGGCAWQQALADAYGRYGSTTQVPSIWFYGANDSYFPPAVITPAHAAYVAAGGRAELVAYGEFGRDAHAMFGSAKGLPIWWPRVEARMEQAGLATRIVHPQFALPVAMAAPALSDFAAIDDATRVPYLQDTGRAGYRVFLGKAVPRAFALARDVHGAWSAEGDDPLRRALETCARMPRVDGRLYAVDGDRVWSEA